MLLFESTELARTEEFLNAHYGPMRVGSTTARPSARIARSASAQISIDRVDFGFDLSYDVDPLDRIALCDITSGTLAGHAPDGSAAETFGQGELFSLSPVGRRYGGTVDHASYTVTLIDPSLLGDVASPGTGEPVRLVGHRPVDAAAARRLRAAIDHLDEVVLSDPVASSSPLVLGAVNRYVAAQVLAAFPTTAAVDRVADSRDAHPATLRRALEHIETHAHLDLTPAEIAAAAHVSIRALQLAFRRHLGTTPMGHLRTVRLARVRRDLEAADPAEASVAQVAARWGFSHQGHFGQAYRSAYGETPGATLRRS
jgi:AraC-like DNA-binding protein